MNRGTGPLPSPAKHGCPRPLVCPTLAQPVARKPIKLRLDGEQLHLVTNRELDRWGGYLNARRGAFELITPDNIAPIRHALMCPPRVDTERVFIELSKQLETGTAYFFEVPPGDTPFDAPSVIDIHDLLPKGDDPDDDRGPAPEDGLHWIEVVCVSAEGESFAGAKARVRLPDGRSEYVTLDGRSSMRFDDLSEGGTAHFELSGDALARGPLSLPGGTRYELGASIGLTTRKRHVLVVHPNPRAFVSVELFVERDSVTLGSYTLTTALGDQAGTLGGEPARAEGFMLPSTARYGFEQVLLPPRPSEGEARGDTDDPSPPDPVLPIDPAPVGDDPITHEPTTGPVPADAVRVTMRLDDGTPLPGTLVLTHSATDEAQGDQAEFGGVGSEGELLARGVRLPV